MSFSVLNVKQNLRGMIHSTVLDKITNPNQVFERAARNLLSKIDPADTIRTQQISNAVHDEIYNYTAPTDLKGKKVIDIRPQVSREKSENFSQRYSKRFDLYKNRESFNIRYNKGVKTLRASFSILPSPLSLHECNSLTQNGTWAVGEAATNLTQDTLNYFTSNASLNFDIDGSAFSAYIENADMTAVDLEDLDEIGQIFVRVYLPSITDITSFTLFWGSSSSAYWTSTVTTPYDQSAFVVGWQILKFDWSAATETGTVDPTAINYLRLTLNLDSAIIDTDFRIDKIDVSSGEIWEIEYYSECLFANSSGTWQTTTDDDTDTVNLDTDGINIFIYECLLATSQQIQGSDAGFDVGFAKAHLEELYAEYKFSHQSEAIRPKSVYYDVNLYSKKRR